MTDLVTCIVLLTGLYLLCGATGALCLTSLCDPDTPSAPLLLILLGPATLLGAVVVVIGMVVLDWLTRMRY